MKSKTRISIIAVILSFVMFMLAVPEILWVKAADEIEEVVQTEQITSESVTQLLEINDEEEPYILSENVSKRRENLKEYIMSDGSIKVQQYAERIHYLDNGEYKEIDNALIETEDGYINSANSFRVNINKSQSAKENIIEIRDGAYSISFDLIDKNANATQTITTDAVKTTTSIDYLAKKLTQPEAVKTTTGKVKFTNIKNNVDIEYEVKNNGIKENIIVNAKQESYVYAFVVQVENLTLELNDDGSIYALNTEEEIIYEIPAPFMIDADGQYSEDVEYILLEKGSAYILMVNADATWINDTATLPVTIDPAVHTHTQTTGFTFTNVFEDGTKTSSGSEVYVGKKSKNESNAYVRFVLPDLGNAYTLTSANFNYYHRTGGINIFRGTNLKYSANVVSDMALSSITYTNLPTVLQYLRTCGANTNVAETNEDYTVEFNVSHAQDNVVTFGFLWLDECSNYMYARIYMSGNNAPYLELTYEVLTGLDDSYSTESAEINGAQAYVNKANGNLTVNMDVASVNTMDMPFNLSLVYNTDYNYILNELGETKIFGNNIKLNYQQFLKQIDSTYYYYDGDGSVQNFVYGTYFWNDSGELKISGNSQIKDSQDNTLAFSGGRITEIASMYNYDVSIVMSYNTSGLLTQISYYTAEAKYNYKFTYNASNLVSTIKLCYKDTVFVTYNLYYTNQNLTRIRNQTSGLDLFNITYDTNNNIKTIYSSMQDGLSFTYSTPGKRVTKIDQHIGSSSNNISNDSIAFNYATNLTTATYTNGGKITGYTYSSFNTDKSVRSEWSEDAFGEITVVNRTNWKKTSSTVREKTIYQYKHKPNTTTDRIGVVPNGTGTITVGNTGIGNDSIRKYVLSFKVNNSSGVDLTFSGAISGSYSSTSGTHYVTLPCSYTTGSITVTNNGGYVDIYDISLTTADYTYIKNGYDSNNLYVFYPAEKVQISADGYYTKNYYDRFKKATKTETKNIYDTVLETTTYTYGSQPMLILGITEPIQTAVTVKNGSTISNVNYTYTNTETSCSTVTVTTKNGIKTRTEQTITPNPNYDTDITDGNALFRTVTETDENGVASSSQYSWTMGDIRLTSQTSGNTTYNYTYDYNGNVTNAKAYNGSTLLASQSYEYTNGINTGGTYQSFDYDYTYNNYGLPTQIKFEDMPKLTYSYDTDGYMTSKTFSNGQSVAYNYTSNKLLSKKTYSVNGVANEDYYSYGYNTGYELASASKVKDTSNMITYYYTTNRDNFTETLAITGNLNYNVNATYNYDKDREVLTSSNVSIKKGTTEVSTYNQNYVYDKETRLTSTAIGSRSAYYIYDDYDRLTEHDVVYDDVAMYIHEYAYETYTVGGVTYTKNQVDKVTRNYNTTDYINYDYDSLGRISAISTPTLTEQYGYDNLNRLSYYMYNASQHNYSYDSNNNLTSETTVNRYGETTSTTTYTYTNLNELTSYNQNGTVKYFGYDALGNMVLYKGSSIGSANNLVWAEGTKLSSGTIGNNTFAYEYDANGMRYKKTVNGATTEYYLDGTTILGEYRSSQDVFIYYIYDQTGIIGLDYGGTKYYLEKNLLGDVIRIYSSTGSVVGNYEYDVWGNCTITDSTGMAITDTTSIMHVNPFRYRSYYYDVETGFYYLQTRYYDPTIKRFISADNYELVSELSQNFGELNLYTYCNNNPIMYTDPTGESIDFWKQFFGITVIVGLFVATTVAIFLSGGTTLVPALVGFGLGAAGNIISQGVSNVKAGKGFFNDINWGNVAISAISGALFATGFGGIVGAAFCGAASSAGMAAFENQSWDNILKSGMVGFVAAGVAYGVGQFVARKIFDKIGITFTDVFDSTYIDTSFTVSFCHAVRTSWYTFLPQLSVALSRKALKQIRG